MPLLNAELCQQGAAFRRGFLLETDNKVHFPCIFFFTSFRYQWGPGFGDPDAEKPHSCFETPAVLLHIKAGLRAQKSPTSESVHQRAGPRNRHQWYIMRMAESGLVPHPFQS